MVVGCSVVEVVDVEVEVVDDVVDEVVDDVDEEEVELLPAGAKVIVTPLITLDSWFAWLIHMP